MKNLFDIKRTRMTDDAAFRHNPVQPGKTVLTFILVYFVAGLLSSLVSLIADSAYNLIMASKSGLLDAYTAAAKAGDAAAVEEILSELFTTIESPWWLVIVDLFATAIVAGAAIFYCLKMEKRPFKSLGLRGGKSAIGESFMGLGIGLLIVLMTAGFAFATTSVSFTLNSPLTGALLLLIPACLVNALGEEILWRGYFMTSIARDTTPLKSIFIMSIVYTVFNIIYLNPILIINAFLFSFLMGLYVFKRGSIWGATLLNFVWTYASTVIFGSFLPNVGVTPSLLAPVFLRADFVSGGELGFFAGLSFTLMLLVSITVLLLTKTKKTEISSFTIDFFA